MMNGAHKSPKGKAVWVKHSADGFQSKSNFAIADTSTAGVFDLYAYEKGKPHKMKALRTKQLKRN
jgi:hypothetical protein